MNNNNNNIGPVLRYEVGFIGRNAEARTVFIRIHRRTKDGVVLRDRAAFHTYKEACDQMACLIRLGVRLNCSTCPRHPMAVARTLGDECWLTTAGADNEEHAV